MAFKKTHIPLYINLNGDPDAPLYSSPFMLPPCKNFSLQFILNLREADPTIISLEQSNNGSSFDPVVDPNGQLVSVEAYNTGSEDVSCTLNVSNLSTLWLRLKIICAAGESGSAYSATLITN